MNLQETNPSGKWLTQKSMPNDMVFCQTFGAMLYLCQLLGPLENPLVIWWAKCVWKRVHRFSFKRVYNHFFIYGDLFTSVLTWCLFNMYYRSGGICISGHLWSILIFNIIFLPVGYFTIFITLCTPIAQLLLSLELATIPVPPFIHAFSLYTLYMDNLYFMILYIWDMIKIDVFFTDLYSTVSFGYVNLIDYIKLRHYSAACSAPIGDMKHYTISIKTNELCFSKAQKCRVRERARETVFHCPALQYIMVFIYI